MILGIGVDSIEISRVVKAMEKEHFVHRIFTEKERAEMEHTKRRGASDFAGKEAVVKALGTGFSCGIGIRDVEVALDSKGKPRAVLHGRAKEVYEKLGIEELPLSLSYTHKEAVACAMAITNDSQKVAKRKVSPTEELTRQFKEVRSLLDDIEDSTDKQD